MKISDVLIEARKKIEKPENWTQGAWARDEENRKTAATKPDACKWCAHGAIHAVVYSGKSTLARNSVESHVVLAALNRALDKRSENSRSVVSYNDAWGTKHEDVLALFDRAIIAEQQKEAGANENV